MLRLIRPFHRHAEIVGLFLGEFGQFHANAFEMQAGDFFVEMFRQAIHADFVRVAVLPEVELREALVGSPREMHYHDITEQARFVYLTG